MYDNELLSNNKSDNVWYRTSAEFMFMVLSVYFTILNFTSALVLYKYNVFLLVGSLVAIWAFGLFYMVRLNRELKDNIADKEKRNEMIPKRILLLIKVIIYAIAISSLIFYGKWHYLNTL